MATNDDTTRSSSLKDTQHRLAGHPEPARIEAHKEAARLGAHDPADDEVVVPPVTADIDETPRFVRYGAAVLLGLAFGVGCYVWFGEGVPSAPRNPGHTLQLPTAQSVAAHRNTLQGHDVPTPFEAYAQDYTTVTPDGKLLASAQSPGGAEQAAPAASATTTASEPTVVYLFNYDSSTVPETPELTAIATRATKQGLSVDVKAYTDEHGRLAYNRKLSERRARAVGDYLVAHGVPAAKVTVHGMGPTHAYSDDAHDRRAEVTVYKK